MLLLGPCNPDAPENSKIATPPTRKRRFYPSRCSKPQGGGHGQSHPPCPGRNFGFQGGAQMRPGTHPEHKKIGKNEARKSSIFRPRFRIAFSAPGIHFGAQNGAKIKKKHKKTYVWIASPCDCILFRKCVGKSLKYEAWWTQALTNTKKAKS